jgi:hypothetical protein
MVFTPCSKEGLNAPIPAQEEFNRNQHEYTIKNFHLSHFNKLTNLSVFKANSTGVESFYYYGELYIFSNRWNSV